MKHERTDGLTDEQFNKLDRAGKQALVDLVERAHGVAEGTCQFSTVLAEKAPFVSCCSIIRQESIVDELRRDSKVIKKLTWGLVSLTGVLIFLTVVLACFAYRLDKVENKNVAATPSSVSQPTEP